MFPHAPTQLDHPHTPEIPLTELTTDCAGCVGCWVGDRSPITLKRASSEGLPSMLGPQSGTQWHTSGELQGGSILCFACLAFCSGTQWHTSGELQEWFSSNMGASGDGLFSLACTG